MVIHMPEEEFEKYREYFIQKEDSRIIKKFNQVRIVPKFNSEFFNVEIVYEKDELNHDLDVNRVASIDIGVNNLITLVDTAMDEEGRVPLIINGRPIKSINQFYNKKSSRFVITYCLENRIGHIVIGRNEGWKQEVNIGKRNNQNFVSIPFDKVIRQIQYKAQLVGIKVTINADVNGALNILRKVIADDFLNPFVQEVARLIPSRGYLCYPIKVCF